MAKKLNRAEEMMIILFGFIRTGHHFHITQSVAALLLPKMINAVAKCLVVKHFYSLYDPYIQSAVTCTAHTFQLASEDYGAVIAVRQCALMCFDGMALKGSLIGRYGIFFG